MKLVTKHTAEIKLLQTAIRAVIERISSKEEVAACDSQSTHAPNTMMMLSPMEEEMELTKETVVITREMVNQCLSDDFGIPNSILKYFDHETDEQVAEKMMKQLDSGEEATVDVDYSNVYGFYHCDGKQAYARVYPCLFLPIFTILLPLHLP